MNHSVHCGLIVSIMDTITPSWTVSVLHGLYDMVPSWTLWPWVYQYHGHYGYIVECGRYGPIVDPTGSSWTPMGSSWTLWVYHRQYGYTGTLWMLWSHRGHLHQGFIMDTICPSWIIWVHHGRYGFTIDTISPSWTLWPTGPLWTLWPWVHHGTMAMGPSWTL